MAKVDSGASELTPTGKCRADLVPYQAALDLLDGCTTPFEQLELVELVTNFRALPADDRTYLVALSGRLVKR